MPKAKKAKKTVKDSSKKKEKKTTAIKTAGDSEDINCSEERAQTIFQPQSTNLGNILESDTPSTEREEDDDDKEDQAV